MFAPGVTIQYRMQSFLVMQLWKKYRTGSFAVVWKYPIVDGWFVFWLVGWLDLKVSLISNSLMCRCAAGVCGRATTMDVLPRP